MKKFKLLGSVVAVILAVGMLSTSALAATFNTTTDYDASGNATVTTTVSGLTAEDVGGQITYIAYKNGAVTSDNILYVNQKDVKAAGELSFSYTVDNSKFAGATATAIGLGTDKVASFAPETYTIGKCTVTAAATTNGTIAISASEAYPNNTVTITITPNQYYELDKFCVGGVETAVVGSTYELTVLDDVEVSATFKAIQVGFDPAIAEDDSTYFPEIGTVTEHSFTINGETVSVPVVVEVKKVIGKVVGNPANYEYGMKVTYSDSSVQYFKAMGLNADGTFAVRLIDISADQTALDDIVSVERYIKPLN